MGPKSRKYRMDESSAWDSPWTLVLILALISLGVGLWLSARGEGWTPRSAGSLVERLLAPAEARAALGKMRTEHETSIAGLKDAHQKKVVELKAQIKQQGRENERLLAEIQKRSATP